jgi:hypothetical protein
MRPASIGFLRTSSIPIFLAQLEIGVGIAVSPTTPIDTIVESGVRGSRSARASLRRLLQMELRMRETS